MNKPFGLWDAIGAVGLPALTGAWIEDWIQTFLEIDIPNYAGSVTGAMVGLIAMMILVWIYILGKFWNGYTK